MPIQITAKRDGFRRCGIAHSETTTTYPDGHFSSDQLRELMGEPNLIVMYVDNRAAAAQQSDWGESAAARITELEAVVLQLNTDADELKVLLHNVTAERDELQVKLGLLTSTGSGTGVDADQVQESQSDAAQDTGAGDDKKSNKKKD